VKLTPERIEHLAAAYALGTLKGGARRRLEALARQHPELREAVQRWQHQLASLTELVGPVAPPEIVWKRIAAQLRADLAQRPADLAKPPARRGGALALLWPGLAGALLALAGAFAYVAPRAQQQGEQLQGLREQLALQVQQVDQARAELAAVARVGHVALLGDKAGAAVLVSYDAGKGALSLRRVGAYREADEKSLQLWTIAPGAAPKSLGVLTRAERERFLAAQADVSETRVLAISLEPLGGVPSERGPTGPVLFTGKVLAL
jgi:anti-sigma-K factor RskA